VGVKTSDIPDLTLKQVKVYVTGVSSTDIPFHATALNIRMPDQTAIMTFPSDKLRRLNTKT
jgi:hypothetical protein